MRLAGYFLAMFCLVAGVPGRAGAAATDPAAGDAGAIVIVAKRKAKPGQLKIQVIDRPRPPQYGSEQLRLSYRISNASAGTKTVLRIRQGLQSHLWVLADHGELTAQELETSILVDVTGDLFAGQDVRMSLLARDANGRSATSKSFYATVPQRFFLHPLAREIAAVRMGLISHDIQVAEAKTRISQISAAAAGDRIDTTVLAALRQIFWRMEYDKSPEGAFELMWLTANHLEDSRRLSLTGLAEHLDHAFSEQDIPLLPSLQ
jgi:hypothetical protein